MNGYVVGILMTAKILKQNIRSSVFLHLLFLNFLMKTPNSVL
jgi:hypothetical protein